MATIYWEMGLRTTNFHHQSTSCFNNSGASGERISPGNELTICAKRRKGSIGCRDFLDVHQQIAHLLEKWVIHWVGLRENLQETMVFTIKYRAFL